MDCIVFYRGCLNLFTNNLIGANATTGLAFPFLFFALYMIRSSSTADALRDWVLYTVLYQVAFSVLLGIAIGYCARNALKFAEKRQLIDKENFLSFGIALTFLTLGGVGWLGSDDLFAAFIAGTTLTWDGWFNRVIEDSHFQEVIDMLFNLTFFVYFGSIIPWATFTSSNHLELWKLFVAAILILFFRRLPIVMALLRFIPALKSVKEGVFAGWFGPYGVGALFFATVAIENMESYNPHGHTSELAHSMPSDHLYPEVPVDSPFYNLSRIIFPVVCFIVLSSVVVHGLTVPLFHFTIKGHERRKAHRASRASSRAEMLSVPSSSSATPDLPSANVFDARRTSSPEGYRETRREVEVETMQDVLVF